MPSAKLDTKGGGEGKVVVLQNQPDGITQWLSANAAGWIVAVVAVVSWIVKETRRKRAKHVVVKEILNSSLLRVSPRIRDKICIKFAEAGNWRDVNAVGQIEAEIFNDGSDTIRNPKFMLTVPSGAKILDAQVNDGKPSAFEGDPVCEVTENTVTVKIDHLNSIRDHKYRLILSLLVDGDTSIETVSGSGEGWSVRYISLPTKTQDSRNAWILTSLAALLGIAEVYSMLAVEHTATKPSHLILILSLMLAGTLVQFCLTATALPCLVRLTDRRRRQRDSHTTTGTHRPAFLFGIRK